MEVGIWLFNTTVQNRMLICKVNAYIKLDLNPYDVILEWMEFMWSSYLYNERNLHHVAIVLKMNTSLRAYSIIQTVIVRQEGRSSSWPGNLVLMLNILVNDL